ncbi:MAG TPA: bifunctional 4-hydroxy-2-oxoglutarate aldolase/2-dehydro-3-deoxy-phosphogluconate aldolase [Acidothermaceae bacterium]|jgi:2-dehydro-3-deoxyphosphogluconate aldolase/(4S)-4-hydroxy-2-oxoglutarate aldolase|nr:bifunctional 4-hydroxy-2-oxoglutarate aldolase/2-dehydro-3-deoxy-phosphogluconate aldolase [Acidothermaceae bacterium]
MTPPMSPVHALLHDERLLPIVVLDDASGAVPMGAAVRAGGLSSLEITLRTPAALAAIRALAREGDLVVGAGTVLTTAQAEEAVDAGASFIVAPGVSAKVVTWCRDAGVPVFPGVATATDIQTALELGIDVVKFFPADLAGGVPAIKALAAPFGGVQFVPTGGVSAANLAAYLEQPSVLAVGGSWLAARSAIASQDWSAITAAVAAAVQITATFGTPSGDAHG